MNLSNILKFASLALFTATSAMLGGCAADTDTPSELSQPVATNASELARNDVAVINQAPRATPVRLERTLADARDVAQRASEVAAAADAKLPVLNPSGLLGEFNESAASAVAPAPKRPAAKPVDSVSFDTSPTRADFDNLIVDEVQVVPAVPAPSPEAN
jgi:hypothetical protein